MRRDTGPGKEISMTRRPPSIVTELIVMLIALLLTEYRIKAVKD